MKDEPSIEAQRANDLRRRKYAKEAPKYDKEMDFFERRLFGTEHRSWACSRAHGETLEVAIGTGLNLPHYSDEVTLTGLDLSQEMRPSHRIRAFGRSEGGRRTETSLLELLFRHRAVYLRPLQRARRNTNHR
jgi:hypothetical protein